jgi:hypothetical protein
MESPPGGPGTVFLTGYLLSLADDDARDLGRLFFRPRIGSQFLCCVASDLAKEERHGGTLVSCTVWRHIDDYWTAQTNCSTPPNVMIAIAKGYIK